MTSASSEAARLIEQLRAWSGPPVTFMEVCGTHTMAAARAGLRQLLPATIRLISGPGCPVCVTPVGYVDHALALAALEQVTIATFGDLVRVPGSSADDTAPAGTLARARASGADVRVVYSPRDAVDLARQQRDREIVFLGVGFETTAPTIAAAVLTAADEELSNLSVLVAAKTIPEALLALASSPELALDGLLCPGHVSVVLGPEAYQPLAEQCGVPCAIAGFEVVEMLRGLSSLLAQVACGQAKVDNCYPGAVRPRGNPKARQMIERVFEPCDSVWRGLGVIPQSGLALRERFARFDAAERFVVELCEPVEPAGCQCGDVLRGVLEPAGCALFGTSCTPEHPRGACMVSSEGSCAAAFTYRSAS